MGTHYVTVHGTGDARRAEPGDEQKWWEPSSLFCQELLSQAPPGSTIESFEWSGANDERHRREAAEALYRNLRQSGAERFVLVGHSHGGSVIATALQFAAARQDPLERLERWVTIGTPFIQMKRRRLPWERYDLFGQALLSFSVLLAVMGIGTLITGDNGWFTAQIVSASFSGVGLCTVLMLVTQRTTRRLHSRRTARHFGRLFKDRWRGIVSSHDEATTGLARLPSIKVSLFDENIVAPAAHAIVSLAFIAFVGLSWLSIVFFPVARMLEQAPGGEFVEGHTQVLLLWVGLFSNAIGGDAPVETFLAGFVGQAPAMLIANVLFAVSSLAIYLFILYALLKLTDLLTRATVGLIVASGLNQSANEMILKRAYGNSTVGEHAYGARTEPFADGASVEVLPTDVNAPLLAYARAHAAETLAHLHDTLFQNNDASDEPLVQGILDRLSWRELIHTAYFKVPDVRRHIVARIVQAA